MSLMLITRQGLARRWGKDARTIDQYAKTKADFPKPIVIGGRKHWYLVDIEGYEKGQAA